MNPETQSDRHPVSLTVDDDLKRNRLTVFFRLLLVIPQAIVLYVWTIVAGFVILIAWITALIVGRVPDGLHDFLARYFRACTHVGAYALLLADPWPPFWGTPGTYPVDLHVAPPQPQNRLTVLFRLPLAIPALLFSYVFRIINSLVAVLGWFYCLVMGRMHRGMRDVSAWMFQYELQTYAYVGLLTSKYPSLSGPSV